jgi:phage tail P2-like protein
MRNLQEITLRELLPPSIINDPNVQAMAASITAEMAKTTSYIPGLAIIHRLRNRQIDDPALLDILAWQLHVDFYEPDLPLPVKQELVASSLDWHTRKGTKSVVEELVTAAFGEAIVEESFEYGGLPYHFRASTERINNTEETIHNLIAAIHTVKNVRSALDYIELVNRKDADFYAAIGQIEEATIAVGLGDPIDTDDRPIIADVYIGVLPEFDFDIMVEAGPIPE